jgi:ATP-dependent DNA ligase
MGLEGIVAKRRDRPYRSGPCADWIKVKNPEHPAIARAELIVLANQHGRLHGAGAEPIQGLLPW